MRHVASAHPLPLDAAPVRDSLGGHPFLPAGVDWPVCPTSNERMVLFFQLDIRPEFGVALAPGSHLAVFMSPATNEIDTFDRVDSGAPLPDAFWTVRLTHFKTYVFGPDTALAAHADADPYLVPHRLEFAPDDDPHDPFLFVGGEPRWYQDAEVHPGFEFVAQLSEDYPFPKQDTAPEQPDTFSRKAYCVFLGNATYLFTRAAPTHPEEVWIVLQN